VAKAGDAPASRKTHENATRSIMISVEIGRPDRSQ
jgi:hypothetical protein